MTPNNRPRLLITDISHVLKAIGRYPHIVDLLRHVALNELVEAMLAVSGNLKPGPLVAENKGYMQTVRDDNDLVWYVIENNVGELFDTLPVNDLEVELGSLLEELDASIGRTLPEGWCQGEYTFHSWLGYGQIVVLKD